MGYKLTPTIMEKYACEGAHNKLLFHKYLRITSDKKKHLSKIFFRFFCYNPKHAPLR